MFADQHENMRAKRRTRVGDPNFAAVNDIAVFDDDEFFVCTAYHHRNCVLAILDSFFWREFFLRNFCHGDIHLVLSQSRQHGPRMSDKGRLAVIVGENHWRSDMSDAKQQR